LAPLDASIDCAADDTVFPPHLASRLGVDPLVAPKGRVGLIGGTFVTVNYAQVTLLLSDGYEALLDSARISTESGFSLMVAINRRPSTRPPSTS
jgi:hypothetical protein